MRKSPTLFIRTLKILMSFFARVEVRGYEHLESPQGKIIASNHVGWADPLWMGYASYPLFLQQMAKRELFVHPLMRWFVSSGGGFPVDRNHTSPATIKHTLTILEQGGLVLIFPEGTRTKGESHFKRGAASIALHAKVDIIPAYYDGPTAIKLSHLFKRPNIRIVFGAPIAVSAISVADKLTAINLTAQINAAMKSISQAP